MTGTIALEEIATLIETIKRTKEGKGACPGRRYCGRAAPAVACSAGGPPMIPSLRAAPPVAPEGYEELFRSVGAKLEDQRGYMVLLVEREASMIVSFSLPLPSYIRVDISRMETFTGFHEVEYMTTQLLEIIDEVRDHRGIPYYQ